jgi:hypothetical protein
MTDRPSIRTAYADDWTGLAESLTGEEFARIAGNVRTVVITQRSPAVSGDTQITITGNLADEPELRFTPVSRGFRITEEPFAANPRVAVPCGRV